MTYEERKAKEAEQEREQREGEARNERMAKAVEMLEARGVCASFEYPGYICVTTPNRKGEDVAFGDAGGENYGWNYNDGRIQDFGRLVRSTLPLETTAEDLALWVEMVLCEQGLRPLLSVRQAEDASQHAEEVGGSCESIDDLEAASDMETAKAACPKDFTEAQRTLAQRILVRRLMEATGRG